MFEIEIEIKKEIRVRGLVEFKMIEIRLRDLFGVNLQQDLKRVGWQVWCYCACNIVSI